MKNQVYRKFLNYTNVFIKHYFHDEKGSTAIEYGLMASLIGVMIITGANTLGGSLNQKFTDVASIISGPSDSPYAEGTPQTPQVGEDTTQD